MRQEYKKQALFDSKRIGMGVFTLFVVFVAFKILTPPSTVVARVESPDSTKTARLRKFYYVTQPSYQIDYRADGKFIWLNLLRLPSSTNSLQQTHSESIEWSPDSKTLHFQINSTSIWSHTFSE